MDREIYLAQTHMNVGDDWQRASTTSGTGPTWLEVPMDDVHLMESVQPLGDAVTDLLAGTGSGIRGPPKAHTRQALHAGRAFAMVGRTTAMLTCSICRYDRRAAALWMYLASVSFGRYSYTMYARGNSRQ